MNRALIIGCPGSGKSTFARRLRDKTGLPLYYLDRLYWREDRTHLSEGAFDECLGEIIRQKLWIIDGNYARTLPVRLARCDAVFFLDYPIDLCLEGIAARFGPRGLALVGDGGKSGADGLCARFRAGFASRYHSVY